MISDIVYSLLRTLCLYDFDDAEARSAGCLSMFLGALSQGRTVAVSLTCYGGITTIGRQ